jgi:hypothetical protein
MAQQQQKSALQLFLEVTQAAVDTESQETLHLSAHALSVILDPIDSCLPSSAGAAAPESTTLTAAAATGRTPTLEAPTTLQQPPTPSANSQPAAVPGCMTPKAIFQDHVKPLSCTLAHLAQHVRRLFSIW